MLTIIGDTHGETDHRLSGEVLGAVRSAERVCHTGDFTTEAVYEAVAAEAGADTAEGSAPLTAVWGNSDALALRERLPETATVEVGGLRVVLAHGHRHDRTSLGLLARQEEADLIAVGHSHTPGIEPLGDALVVNPGSYADPRGSSPAYARVENGGQVEVRTPAGDLLADARAER